MRCAGKSTGSKSHQHDVINFWAFLIFHLPTGLGQHCWLNVVLYSSGYYRNVEDKMLPRALCKSQSRSYPRPKLQSYLHTLTPA
ncbi:hypothetical protein BD309DRAFT_623978 [Dichomitus squalens]|nr:hypothetical protein BD309DRAFT_623978 [Dichomitus squalens]